MSPLQITLVGGGMITHDQLLPSLYHLQRQGVVGEIAVCDLAASRLQRLADSELFGRAFPGQSFTPYTDPYGHVIAKMPTRNLVVVAVPDHLHFDVIMTALRADQHVLTVKPLVLKASDAAAIEREASTRGLLVAVEYHKRFDDRSFMARQRYRQGLFGEFKLGTCCLLEKWYYRHSNFQNWCTLENSDAFTYVGCHYVDLVHFITGLRPVSVSLYGLKDKYPNGNEGFLWTDARVIWENGACLNVQNALGYPDDAPGSNAQGITMYCAGGEMGALISHSDQFRGVTYSCLQRPFYTEPSPDYFQYIDLGAGGLVPVGYGYRSVDFIVRAVVRIETGCEGLRDIDQAGVIATPANSIHNELVIEAGRLSILNGGREALIDYESRQVRLRA